jgi:hypothetical protein
MVTSLLLVAAAAAVTASGAASGGGAEVHITYLSFESDMFTAILVAV